MGRGSNWEDRAGTRQPFGNLQNETNMVLKYPEGYRLNQVAHNGGTDG